VFVMRASWAVVGLFVVSGGCDRFSADSDSPAPATPAVPAAGAEAGATGSAASAASGVGTPAAPSTGAAPAENKPLKDWSYEGDTGPDHWGTLQPEFAKCGNGQAQSPIDLPEGKGNGNTPGPVTLEYKPVPLAIQNDGHAVIFQNSSESSVLIDGQRYFFVRGELHSPAEHRVGGKAFDMELELVHRNEADELAVFSVLFNKGEENLGLKTIFDYLPFEVSGQVDVVPGVNVDLTKFISSELSYRYYEGSLTSPPCSEGVRWFVSTKAGTVSENQLKRYQSVMKTATNRPLQPSNNRKVGIFNR
jgi:carbonic anhydrase